MLGEISLYIPVYNGEKTIKRAINSILNQSLKPKDILIINDGSQDSLKFKSNSLKIMVINLNNNFGVGHCMKMAINYAIQNNYKKFCRIDSDGEHDPTYIDKILYSLDDKDFIIGERNTITRIKI